MKQTPLKRTPFGQKQRQRVQWEAQQATALEGTPTSLGLFQLHHVDYLHLSAPMRDTGTLKAGHPDYLLIGKDWLAFLEIKARNLTTGRIGRLSAAQHVFHAKLQAAGAEVWTAWLPDDLKQVNDWLAAKTGIKVDIDGLR